MLRQEKKQCFFCTANSEVIDYKDAELLRRFLSSRAKIYPRRKSGICAKHQRMLARAVKRATFMALIPFTTN